MFCKSTVAIASILFSLNLMAAEVADDYSRIYLGSSPTVVTATRYGRLSVPTPLSSYL